MLETPEKKKSLAITIGLFMLLFLVLFLVGLSNLVTPTEQGIAVNFGTSDFGKGKVQTLKTVRTTPSPSSTPPSPEVNETKQVKENTEETLAKEKVVTQDIEEAPVLESEKAKKLNTVKNVEAPKKENDGKKAILKKVSKPIERKPDESTKNALDQLLNGAKKNGELDKGQGNDTSGGDQGRKDGDPKAKSYYGTGKGLDGDGNYRLGGRKALNKARKIPDCNETGIVVVKIVVNRAGKVIEVVPGIKGTTNTAECLMKPATQAALATKFNSDSEAPFKQVGSIVYNFKVTE